MSSTTTLLSGDIFGGSSVTYFFYIGIKSMVSSIVWLSFTYVSSIFFKLTLLNLPISTPKVTLVNLLLLFAYNIDYNLSTTSFLIKSPLSSLYALNNLSVTISSFSLLNLN